MLKVKKSVLGLVIGGAMILAAPAMAQDSGKPGKGASPASAQPQKATAKIGQPAPDFELKDTDGKTVKLSDYKGKIVVLDWVNPGCPVCQMHYKAGTVQNLASKYATVLADGTFTLRIELNGTTTDEGTAVATSPTGGGWRLTRSSAMFTSRE